MPEPIQRNLAIELMRVTEAAAMAAAHLMGRGNKEAADQAAVEAMRFAINAVDMDGIVVLGEGIKDKAPMLYIGERLGNGTAPEVDVAVDPVEGTRLVANGQPNALSVVAASSRGSMFHTELFYMEKLAVGPEAAQAIDIAAPVETNLRNVAKAKGYHVADLTVVILDRPRHENLIRQVRATGARIRLIPDGDVAGALMTALPGTGIDVLMGVGGSPEAIVSACALKCVGGALQCRLWPRNDAEREQAAKEGISLTRVLTADDLVKDDDACFAATGITDGELLQGVRYFRNGARTHSLVARSRSGTVRFVEAVHDFTRLMKISSLPYETMT